MKVLVINAGSSSLKFQLIDMDNESVIAKGICEEIGGKSGFKFKVPGREDYKLSVSPHSSRGASARSRHSR